MRDCKHEGEYFLERKLSRAEVWNVFKVCKTCGFKFGSMVPLKSINIPLENIPVFDDAREQRLWDEYRKAQDEKYAKYKAEKELEIGARARLHKEEFFQWYNEYLLSPEWREKREKVLIRDKRLCQSCLSAGATQVHHTTYKHVGFEPLFELVSVCDECHEKITKMDRGIFE